MIPVYGPHRTKNEPPIFFIMPKVRARAGNVTWEDIEKEAGLLAGAVISFRGDAGQKVECLGYEPHFGCVYFKSSPETAGQIAAKCNCILVSVPDVPPDLIVFTPPRSNAGPYGGC